MQQQRGFIHKKLVLTLLILCSATIAAYPSNRTVAKPKDFTFTLKAENETITLGEKPTLSATIKNNSGKEVLLVPALDGSTSRMRYPVIQFIVTKPADAPPTQGIGRCGNTNNIQLSDFIKVPKNGTFRPLSQWGGLSAAPFTAPGTYTVQFTYSTDAKAEQWHGFMGPMTPIYKLSIKGKLAQVPIMNLKSNVVTITVVAPPEDINKTEEDSP